MTLLMRDQENIEKGIRQGMQQGIQRGIQQGIRRGVEGAVELLRDAGWEDARIKAAIMKRYNLAENEAEDYIYGNT